MVLAVGVEVGTGRGTAVGVVSKLVDVEASLGVGVEVLDLIGDYQVSKWMVPYWKSNDLRHQKR